MLFKVLSTFNKPFESHYFWIRLYFQKLSQIHYSLPSRLKVFFYFKNYFFQNEVLKIFFSFQHVIVNFSEGFHVTENYAERIVQCNYSMYNYSKKLIPIINTAILINLFWIWLYIDKLLVNLTFMNIFS